MASLRDIKELVPTEVGTWLDENKDTYMEGFFYGFADDGTKYMETVNKFLIFIWVVLIFTALNIYYLN